MSARVMVIDIAQAEKLFNEGYTVGVRPVGRDDNPNWCHIAVGYARTFEEFAHGKRWWGDDLELEFVRPLTTRKLTRVEAAGSIFRREPFEIGSISGTPYFAPGLARGDLPGEYHESFEASAYAVWSYETPIAWVNPDGSITMPPVRYSNTTTQHQLLVARAFGVPFSTTESARKGKGKTPYTSRKGSW